MILNGILSVKKNEIKTIIKLTNVVCKLHFVAEKLFSKKEA